MENVQDRSSKHKKIYDDAERYFSLMLYSEDGKKALSYAKKRGLDEKTISDFGLGAAPEEKQGKTIIEYLEEKGYSEKEICSAGLAKGKMYDRLRPAFTGRLMFPIRNEKGDTVGFAGRDLQSEKEKRPKYLNTSFEKGSTLYGIDLAKTAETKDIVICEGYMDVIAMRQAGHPGCVALMGTALTDKQTDYLKDYRNIFFCLDGDEAGQMNAKKNMEHLYKQGMHNIYNIKLPDGHDPDELLRAGGKSNVDRHLKPKTIACAEIDRLKKRYENKKHEAPSINEIIGDHSIDIAEKGIAYMAEYSDRKNIRKDINYLSGQTGFPYEIIKETLSKEMQKIREEGKIIQEH